MKRIVWMAQWAFVAFGSACSLDNVSTPLSGGTGGANGDAGRSHTQGGAGSTYGGQNSGSSGAAGEEAAGTPDGGAMSGDAGAEGHPTSAAGAESVTAGANHGGVAETGDAGAAGTSDHGTSCAVADLLPADCTGLQHAGESCAVTKQCAPGLRCFEGKCSAGVSSCRTDIECGAAARCRGTTCGPRCVPRSSAPCADTAVDCPLSYRCAVGQCVFGPVEGETGAGAQRAECAHGFYADANHVCEPRAGRSDFCVQENVAGGPHCREDMRCVFHHASNRTYCQPLGGQDDECQTVADCQPGFDCAPTSLHGFTYCFAPIPVGGTCGLVVNHGNCVVGSRCLSVPVSEGSSLVREICVAYPGLGEACADTDHCGPGLLCKTGSCVTPPITSSAPLGAACDLLPCATDLVCASAVDNGSCEVPTCN